MDYGRKKYEFLAAMGCGGHLFAVLTGSAGQLLCGAETMSDVAVALGIAYAVSVACLAIGMAGMTRCDAREAGYI